MANKLKFLSNSFYKLDHHKKGEKAHVVHALISSTKKRFSRDEVRKILVDEISISANLTNEKAIKHDGSSKIFNQIYTVGIEWGIWNQMAPFTLSKLSIKYLDIFENKGIEAAQRWIQEKVFINHFRFIDEKIFIPSKFIFTYIYENNLFKINKKNFKEIISKMPIEAKDVSMISSILFAMFEKTEFFNSHKKISEFLKSKYFVNLENTIKASRKHLLKSSIARELYSEVLNWDYNVKSYIEEKFTILKTLSAKKGYRYSAILKSTSWDMLNSVIKIYKMKTNLHIQNKELKSDYLKISSYYWKEEISFFANMWSLEKGILRNKISNQIYATSKFPLIKDNNLYYEFEKNKNGKESNKTFNNEILHKDGGHIFIKIGAMYLYLGFLKAFKKDENGVFFKLPEWFTNINKNGKFNSFISIKRDAKESIDSWFSEKSLRKNIYPPSVSKNDADKSRKKMEENGEKAENIVLKDQINIMKKYCLENNIDFNNDYVKQISKSNDNAGYDIEVYDPINFSNSFIEVKNVGKSKSFETSLGQIKNIYKNKEFMYALVYSGNKIYYMNSEEFLKYSELIPTKFKVSFRSKKSLQNIEEFKKFIL